MDKKETLLEVILVGRSMGEDLARVLSRDEQAQTGTWETWAPKDVYAHVTYWLAHDLDNLSTPDLPIDLIGPDRIEETNRQIFDNHRDLSWEEIFEHFVQTFERASDFVSSLDRTEIDQTHKYSDGSGRPVWRAIAGHALMHLAPHLGVVYARRGQPDKATGLEERAVGILLGLDNSPLWIGTLKYNLACHFAGRGAKARAIELLRIAFEHNPELAEWSRTDSDLDPIRSEPGFQEIYEK